MAVRRLLASAADVLQVLMALPRVEHARRACGPKEAAARMRRRGLARARRPEGRREDLRRAIRLVDRLCVGNCYRRALLEIALDPVAAGEPLVMGFRRGGGSGSGHAWIGSGAPAPSDYDLVVSV